MSDSFRWPAGADPFRFLEALDSKRARTWVDEQKARTRAALRDDDAYRALTARLAKAYLPRERPVIPTRWRDWAYDLWQDDLHPKGLWRRTRWDDWRAGKPAWETLLDVDALGAQEGESWVFEQDAILYPDGDRALLSLSPGAPMRSSCANSISSNAVSSTAASRSTSRGITRSAGSIAIPST